MAKRPCNPCFVKKKLHLGSILQSFRRCVQSKARYNCISSSTSEKQLCYASLCKINPRYNIPLSQSGNRNSDSILNQHYMALTNSSYTGRIVKYKCNHILHPSPHNDKTKNFLTEMCLYIIPNKQKMNINGLNYRD